MARRKRSKQRSRRQISTAERAPVPAGTAYVLVQKPMAPRQSRISSKSPVTRRKRALQIRSPYRGDPLRVHRQKASRKLSDSRLSLFNNHENARARARTKVCTRTKAERRAVILATGYGGVNGQRKYKPRRKCK